MRVELQRLGALVTDLGTASAQRFGQVDESLRTHAEVAGDAVRLHAHAARGARQPPGPRSVGRAHGRGRAAPGRLRRARQLPQADPGRRAAPGRPDFTFDLPKGHVLYMDVKFPLAVVPALPRGRHRRRAPGPPASAFLRDVRLRVKELAERDYAREGDRPSVDYVLLFLPNEQLSGFIHEHDPTLLDDAIGQRVVLCSPLTLFAFLGVIRQAFDNFMIEQTSDEILPLIGKFDQQWQKYTESAREGEAPHRLGAAGVRPAHRHPPAGPRTAAAAARGAARPAATSRSTASCSPTPTSTTSASWARERRRPTRIAARG